MIRLFDRRANPEPSRLQRVRSWAARRFWPAATSINDYERRVYSQNGEDGIINELFRRLGTGGTRFVEFGVGDGSQCNTAVLARSRNWSGVMIEADPTSYEKLHAGYAAFARVRTVCRRVTAENIAPTLVECGVPREFDLLSIDVDGNDYWLWLALADYHPRVVIIEYNAAYPPPAKWVMAYNPDHVWNGTTYHGASLASLALLGTKLGYVMIGTDRAGVNAFFVARELLDRSGFRELFPQQAYHRPRFGSQLRGHPRGDGPALEI